MYISYQLLVLADQVMTVCKVCHSRPVIELVVVKKSFVYLALSGFLLTDNHGPS